VTGEVEGVMDPGDHLPSTMLADSPDKKRPCATIAATHV
jgi:hypothetical protein